MQLPAVLVAREMERERGGGQGGERDGEGGLRRERDDLNDGLLFCPQ